MTKPKTDMVGGFVLLSRECDRSLDTQVVDQIMLSLPEPRKAFLLYQTLLQFRTYECVEGYFISSLNRLLRCHLFQVLDVSSPLNSGNRLSI